MEKIYKTMQGTGVINIVDILCRIPGASYIFYVFFGRIRARAARGVCL